MVAYGGPCGAVYLGADALTDVSGKFTLGTLSPGQVYLKACATCRVGFTQANGW